jgi:DNA polymerase-3 subunit delta'
MAIRNIIGQDRSLRILFGTLKRNRIPSAILLSGELGIGKRLAALNYAKAINCLQPVDFDCCDKCISCRKIDHDNHPDILIITLQNMEDKLDLKKRETKDSNRYEIPIEAVRKIEEILSFKPSEGNKKILIIDDADAMNDYAANAFLKTLEEPPSNSILLLISSNPDALPATIRSRCINVRFYPLSVEQCREIVLKKFNDSDADRIIALITGRPGLALSGNLIEEVEWFSRLLKDMIAAESKDTWQDKAAIKLWLDICFIFLRDMIIALEFGDRDYKLRIVGHKFKDYNSMLHAHNKDIRTIFDVYQTLLKIRELLDFNLNKSITWNYVANIMKKAIGNGQ